MLDCCKTNITHKCNSQHANRKQIDRKDKAGDLSSKKKGTSLEIGFWQVLSRLNRSGLGHGEHFEGWDLKKVSGFTFR